MEYKGINIDVKNKPFFEQGYIPTIKFIDGYLKSAKEPFAFAVERNDGYISKFDTFICGDNEKHDLDLFYLKLITQIGLRFWGGWKLYLCGNIDLAKQVQMFYASDPQVSQLTGFAKSAYDKDFCIEFLDYKDCPENEGSQPVGNHFDGCRIGFDGGASDRKVSAVIDGEVIYSEEVLWSAKFNPDIEYHYNEILTAFKTAASKLPKVDAIGVSTASLVVDNLLRFTSFFKMVPPEIAAEKGKDIYQRAASQIGDNIPIVIANDGAVSALAGSMLLKKNKLLGIAVGTSVGMGYVDGAGNLTKYTASIYATKLALHDDAALDEPETSTGVGDSYFSQNNVVRLGKQIGIEMPEELYPAEKLLIIQDLMEKDDPKVQKIYEHIGAVLAHTLPLCALFFDMENVYLCGRIFSNKGGDLIVSECNRILAEEYPDVSKKTTVWLLDENARRVSQSVAAASLPKL